MRTALVSLAILGSLFVLQPLRAAEPTFQLQEGDRVTLLGAGFVERLQQTGYLETALTIRRPDLNVTYRNLGWSGDTVSGEARAVFGNQPQGFQRLMRDVKLTEPTVILVAYGNNEAYAGAAGLPKFEQGLNHLLDQLATTKARLVLLSPVKRENVGPPLPDPTAYNEQVKAYGDAIKSIAAARQLPYIELNPLANRRVDYSPVDASDRITSDSLTLSTYGTWLAAQRLADALGYSAKPVTLTVNVDTTTVEATGAQASDFKAADNRWEFDLTTAQLPYAPLPEHAPAGSERHAATIEVVANGLAEGATYRLLINGEAAASGKADQWSQGVAVVPATAQQQTARLRNLIVEKNELFFNRHRPQNETYLFLFRKHEQGNNAVEIPQFDPLIESKENEIANARVPQKQHLVLERVQ